MTDAGRVVARRPPIQAADRLAAGVEGLVSALRRRPAAPSPATARRLEDVDSLVELYREWYPFSARFLAALDPVEEGFESAIVAPLGLWYELARPEPAATGIVAELAASGLLELARETDAARQSRAWAAVEAGAPPHEMAVQPAARFLRLAAEAGASRALVRLAFAQPLATVFACAAPDGPGAGALATAASRWARSVRLGGQAGRLGNCVRPFVCALRTPHVELTPLAGARHSALAGSGFGRRGW